MNMINVNLDVFEMFEQHKIEKKKIRVASLHFYPLFFPLKNFRSSPIGLLSFQKPTSTVFSHKSISFLMLTSPRPSLNFKVINFWLFNHMNT